MIMNKFSILIAFLIFSSHFIWSQRNAPGDIQTKIICIEGATIHIGNGKVIEKSDIIFEKGKITYVGQNAHKQGVEVIPAHGKHVYPGFILLNSILGLIEIDAVKASEDFTEIEEYHPEVRSLVAFNTDSKIIPTVRRNGVLLVQSTLKSGTIWGTSSIMQLDAWNWEDAAVKVDDAVHLDFPSKANINWRRNSSELNKQVDVSVQRLKDFLARAFVYKEDDKEKDFKLNAMAPIFNGTKALHVSVQDVSEAKMVLDIIEKYPKVKLVFKSEEDLSSLATELNKKGIGVVISRIHRLANAQDVLVEEPYALAKKYFDAGILFSLDYEGDMEAMGSRNLPFLAGTSIAYGLPYEEGVKAITWNAAKMVGIEKDYGSIEVGKSATLFISDGDALDMKSNKVLFAYIDGRAVKLSSHQEELEALYKEKYQKQKLNQK